MFCCMQPRLSLQDSMHVGQKRKLEPLSPPTSLLYLVGYLHITYIIMTIKPREEVLRPNSFSRWLPHTVQRKYIVAS